MREFHHIGMITDQQQAGEEWVEETRVWVTNPLTDPRKVEWLRFEPDSPVTGPVRDQPHIAYKVPTGEFESYHREANVILGPFNPRPKMQVVFIEEDGAVVEYLAYDDVKDTPWG